MEDDGIQGRLELLGERIRTVRVIQGLSQDKLALMIGSGQSYIYRVEAGRLNIGIDKLFRIADALGVDATELLEFN